MNPEIHQRILQTMADRNMPNNPDNYRKIASELGKRGAMVRARKNPQGMMGSKTIVHKDKKKEASKKAARGPVQGEFKFDEQVSYILKDLLS